MFWNSYKFVLLYMEDACQSEVAAHKSRDGTSSLAGVSIRYHLETVNIKGEEHT
jgi:hypothetical protein